jgi:biopolymer transport protein ExbB
MLGLAAFNILSNQVRLVIHQMETIRTMVLNRTDGAPMVPPLRARVPVPSGAGIKSMASAG